MKDKITVTGDDLWVSTRAIHFARWPGRGRDRQRTARCCLNCALSFTISTCSAWGTWCACVYLIHGICTKMSVIANTDMELITDPLAIRLRGATQLTVDSQGTNTDLNRLSTLYLSTHVHTQLVHNSQGTNTGMESTLCLSTPGCTQPVHNSQGTNTGMERLCLSTPGCTQLVPRCQSQLHITPLTTGYIRDATEVSCLSKVRCNNLISTNTLHPVHTNTHKHTQMHFSSLHPHKVWKAQNALSTKSLKGSR